MNDTLTFSGLLIKQHLQCDKTELNIWLHVVQWCMWSSSFIWHFPTGSTNTSAFWNLCFSYMQSNWFTPLNMCQVSDVQPSITTQQQLRLESWCSSAGPQGVLACQHLQSGRERAEKPVHWPVPWSPLLWAFSKHHWSHWNHPASNYSGFVHTAHKSVLSNALP